MSVSGRGFALVAGAAGELGSATLVALQQHGWTVAGIDSALPPCEHALALDMGSRDAVNRGVESLVEALGPVGCLIVATVAHDRRAFGDLTPQIWRQALASHVLSAANLCWAVLPAMIERGGGNIVTLTSAAALGEPALGAHSAAAAGALIGFTKALAIEVAASGVQVNAVAASLQGEQAAAAEAVAGTVRYLVEEPHFFAGQVLSPSAGAVI